MSTCGFDLHLLLPHLCCNLVLLPLQLLRQFGTPSPPGCLWQIGLKGTYHGLLAELHSLVVDQDGTDASAEALVSQLVQENVLRLTTPGVPRNGTNHIHIRQQDAQYVLWLMLDRLAREVGLGCMLLLSKSCDSPPDGLPGRPQQQGLASGIAC